MFNVDMNDPTVVLELMTTAVEEQGADYRYYSDHDESRGCEYFVNGKSACIVGRVLDYAGVDFNFNNSVETPYGIARPANGQTINCVAPHLGITNQNVIDILRTAQDVQDGEGSWGTALADAFSVYNRRGLGND